MTREEDIQAIAKIIHSVEFPNSACWFGCNKCSYNSTNCDYLKAAEKIYDEKIKCVEVEIARKIFADIEQIVLGYASNGEYGKRLLIIHEDRVDELKKKYRVED